MTSRRASASYDVFGRKTVARFSVSLRGRPTVAYAAGVNPVNLLDESRPDLDR
jgi:hypothetical protein